MLLLAFAKIDLSSAAASPGSWPAGNSFDCPRTLQKAAGLDTTLEGVSCLGCRKGLESPLAEEEQKMYGGHCRRIAVGAEEGNWWLRETAGKVEVGTIVPVEAGSRVRKEVVGRIALESLFSK